MAGGGCVHCGYARSLRGLSFHHKDQSTKTRHNDRSTIFGAGALRSMKWPPDENFMAEFAKVELICSNCHMEEEERRVHGDNDWSRLDVDPAVYAGLASRYHRIQSRATCATADLAREA